MDAKKLPRGDDHVGERSLEPRDVAAPTLTVAITGHRILPDGSRARLQTIADQILALTVERIAERCAGELGVAAPSWELRFLSALAPGADLVGLAAATARRHTGWQTHGIIPFPLECYRDLMVRDADGAALPLDLAEFDRLLNLLDRTWVLADWNPGVAAGAGLEHWLGRRYDTVGQLLVRQADILIAMWDGSPARGPGGTAAVIDLAVRQGRPVIWIEPTTLAIRILPTGSGETGSIDDFVRIDPTGLSQSTDANATAATRAISDAIDAALAHILPAQFQRPGTRPLELAKLSVSGPSSPSRNVRHYCPFRVFMRLMLVGIKDSREHGPSHPRTSKNLSAPADLQAMADLRATRLGELYRSAYLSIFLLPPIAIGLGLASLFFDHRLKRYFVTTELAILAMIFLLYLAARRWQWHWRWINARQIAEQLRGLTLMGQVGLSGRDFSRSSDEFHARYVINDRAALPGIPTGRFDRAKIDTVIDHTIDAIDDQIAYHERSHLLYETLHHRLDNLGWALIGLAAIIELAFITIAWSTHGHVPDLLATFTTFAGGFLPALAAALAGIRFQGDFERIATRSRQTARALGVARRSLNEVKANALRSPEAASPILEPLLSILTEVQHIFQRDVEDWHFIYAARPVPGL